MPVWDLVACNKLNERQVPYDPNDLIYPLRQTRDPSVDSDRPLLWVLRSDLELSGAKFGCGEGHWGACTVLINNEAMPSCQLSVGSVAGSDIRTIEGLAKNGQLHAIQEAFVMHDATGARVLQLPMTFDRVKGALQSRQN